MDKISEVFDSIKERVSNPLIFSFIFSWLIFNWRIPVALFWFDEKQISANGCSSIFEFIEDEWKRNGYFWTPFFLALAYTFGFPIFKNLVSAFQTWIEKWGEDWNLKISKNSKISLEKYLVLRESYLEKTQKLEEIITSESKYLIELGIKNNELNELQEKSKSLEEKIGEANEFLSTYRNDEFLNGSWLFKKFDDNGVVVEETTLVFEKKQVYGKTILGELYLKYDIINYYNILKEKRIQFVKEVPNYFEPNSDKGEGQYIVCDLTYNDFGLRGKENRYRVEYSRDSNDLPF